MIWRRPFDEALDGALDAVFNGERLDDVLALYPQHAAALRPLLETATGITPGRDYVPPSSRLMDARHRIAAAARDARAAHQPSRHAERAPWWSRRITFASLSLPVAGVVLASLSATSAAAATVALTTDLPERVAHQVERVTPGWSHSMIPGGDEGSDTPGTPTAGLGLPPTSAVVTAEPTSTHAPAETLAAPDSVAVTGVVTGVRGNVIDVDAADGLFMVQTDAKTLITGDVLVGVTLTAEGHLTPGNRLHAISVVVAAQPVEPSTPAASTPAADATQGGHTPPGQAERTHTPPGQADKTKTPGPPPKTKTPGPPATPPGQGGGNENGNGNGNGNAGGNGNGGGGGN